MQIDPHAPVKHQARFEFFAELNDFLAVDLRNTPFTHAFIGTPTVKDCIEAIGVPHPEVVRVCVDGRPVDFACLLQGGEQVRVFPETSLNAASQPFSLQPAPPDPLRFIVDVNLGTLATKLRLLGFDTLYRNDLEDTEIVACSLTEQRMILTRDIGVLKYGAVRWGYWVRSDDPAQQVCEVVQRFHLQQCFTPLSRCSACNGRLHPVERAAVVDRLPADTQRYYARFLECDDCRKLYWKGAHHEKIIAWIDRLQRC